MTYVFEKTKEDTMGGKSKPKGSNMTDAKMTPVSDPALTQREAPTQNPIPAQDETPAPNPEVADVKTPAPNQGESPVANPNPTPPIPDGLYISGENSECKPPRLVSVFADPPRKNVFLLSCMDQRLLDDTVRFMNSMNLQNRYDQLTVAGGAMGINRLGTPVQNPRAFWKELFTDHLAAAIDTLHRPIKDIFLVDHLDCGAYKYLFPPGQTNTEYCNASLECMRDQHLNQLEDLAKHLLGFCNKKLEEAKEQFKCWIESCLKNDANLTDDEKKCCKDIEKELKTKYEAWEGIRISCFIMNLLGVVTQYNLVTKAEYNLSPHAQSETKPSTPCEK